MNELSLSVVIPSYNRAHCLPRSIESALAQTWSPKEVIVVDDGSTDATEAACEAAGPLVRYIRQARAGVAAARNNGVENARGDWVAFLDADDVWLPQKLEVQLSAMLAHPGAGWCTCEHVTTDQHDVPLPGPQGLTRDLPGFAAQREAPWRLLAQDLERHAIHVRGVEHELYVGDAFRLFCFGNLVLPSAVIVRRDAFLSAGGFNTGLRVASDTEFFHRLAASAEGMFVLTPLLLWRRGRSDTIVADGNIVPLIETAIASLRSGARARGPMTPAVARAFQRGERRLLRRLAYTHLTRFEVARARAVALGGAGAGLRKDPVLWALAALSLTPRPLLRLAWQLKRSSRR